MGAGKQPRFAAALPPVKLDALFTFDSTRDAFQSCLSSRSHQRTICPRPPGLRSVAGKAERDDSPVGLSREPAPHHSLGIAGGTIPQELA